MTARVDRGGMHRPLHWEEAGISMSARALGAPDCRADIALALRIRGVFFIEDDLGRRDRWGVGRVG